MRITYATTTGLATLVLLTTAACGGSSDEPRADPSSSSTSSSSSQPTDPAQPTVDPSAQPAGFGDGPPGSGLQRFYRQRVSWTSCEGGTCADIWVPLDYHDPDGRAITIKAKMQEASGSAQGTVFINPGGPGGSGIDYLDYVNLGSDVTSRFNVVGFDPRGVGQSTPIDCLSDSQLDAYISSDPSPDDAGEVQQFERSWQAYTQGCQQKSGDLMQHMSTVEAAKDMDILRAVVHDPKFHYFGASYGTYLGATYAALFPKNVGRMVLDGAVDPQASPHASAVFQTKGFQTALSAYLRDCTSSGNCPLGDTPAAAQQKLMDLFAQVDAKPQKLSDGRMFTEGQAFLGVITPLYDRTSWTYLTQGLQSWIDGDPSMLQSFADIYTDRNADGTYKSNSMEAQSAVNCLDKPEHESIADIEQGKGDFLRASPVFGPAAMWWPYGCSNWPARAAWPQPDFSAKGAAPILVVGTTRDPATPYEQAVHLSKELDSGVLLTRDGDGHTAYGSGNQCIVNTVDAYLADGTVPPDGKRC